MTDQEGVGMSGRFEEEIRISPFREPGGLKEMAAVKGLNSECGA